MLHDWFNKGHGMCYPVCGMVHITEPLLLIGRSTPIPNTKNQTQNKIKQTTTTILLYIIPIMLPSRTSYNNVKFYLQIKEGTGGSHEKPPTRYFPVFGIGQPACMGSSHRRTTRITLQRCVFSF